jgi:hypothetical protein
MAVSDVVGENCTSLTLVQKNRRFGDRSIDRRPTSAVFGAGRLHLLSARYG